MKIESPLILNDDKSLFIDLNKNYPLLLISRQVEGMRNIHFVFSGLKKINLKYGKEPVDYVINTIKKDILNEINSGDLKGKVIQNNYKTLNIDLFTNKEFNFKIDFKKILFDDEIHNNILKEIGINHFSKINKGKALEEKIKSFYDTSFNGNSVDLGVDINLDFNIIKKSEILANKILEIENKIYTIYSEYQENGKNSEKFWNDFNFVKKGGKLSNIKLEKLFLSFKKIIDVFDIIMPFSGEVNFDKFEKENNVLEKINKNNLNNTEKLLIKKTYKGVLSKKEFINDIIGKKGFLLFFDIIGMGLSNIKNNREYIIETILNKGKTTKEKEDILLESGLINTNNALKTIDELNKQFTDSYCTIEGDEIFMFIPNKKNIEYNDKEKITDSFNKNGFSARSTFVNIDTEEYNEKNILKILNNLDRISDLINKNIENDIEIGELKDYKNDSKENKNLNSSLIKKEIVQKIIEEKKEKRLNFYKVNFDNIFGPNNIQEEIIKKTFTILEKDFYSII